MRYLIIARYWRKQLTQTASIGKKANEFRRQVWVINRPSNLGDPYQSGVSHTIKNHAFTLLPKHRAAGDTLRPIAYVSRHPPRVFGVAKGRNSGWNTFETTITST